MADRITVNSNNFKNEVLESDKTVLVDFWASWCGPCRMLSPLVDEIAKEHDDFKVCALDVDASPEIAGNYNVSAIPTLIVFKNGKEANRSVGFVPKDQILSLVQNA